MGRRPHSAARTNSCTRAKKAKNGDTARLRPRSVTATVGRVETDHSILTFLVVAAAALLMILAAVTARRLEWKRPTLQRLETREHRATKRPVDGPRLRWPRILAISAPCAVAGLASGVALASAVVSPATLAYIAAAAFVAVLAVATR